MTLNLKTNTTVALLSTLLCAAIGAAQTPSSVDRPALKVGNSWTYQTVDLYTKNVLLTTTESVREVKSDGYILKQSRNGAAEQEIVKSLDLGTCLRSKDATQPPVCLNFLHFPLTEGKSYGLEKIPLIGDVTMKEAQCVIKKLEPTETPAGTFDSVPVKCTGTWNRPAEGKTDYFGHFELTYWYAPRIGSVVKRHLERRASITNVRKDMKGRLETYIDTTLTHYSATSQ